MIQYDRYRNRSTPNAPGTQVHTVNGSVTNSSLDLPALTSEQVYDTQIEHFHRRKAAGEIFNNPFLKQRVTFLVNDVYDGDSKQFNSAGTLLASSHDTYTRKLLYQSFGAEHASVSLDVEEAARKGQIDALAAVNSTDVDAAAFAGEWHKTKALHRDLGNALLRLFNGGAKAHVVRSRFRKIPVYNERGLPVLNRRGQPTFRYLHEPSTVRIDGENFARRAANLYLAGRYGVLPLLKDLEDACKFLQRKFNPRFTARGNVTLQGQSESVRTLTDYKRVWTVKFTTTRTYVKRYGLLYETDPLSRSLAQLGLTRPLSTAWELAPWSFVGDWFLSVGKYLDAIQPAGFYKTLCAWDSTRETNVTTAEIVGWASTASLTSTESFTASWTGGYTYMTELNVRDWWNTRIPPRPALGSGFSQLRSADFAALMLQKIRIKL